MVRKLTISLDASDLPKEILLFRAGWNDTEKGQFLFDDEAAALVLGAQAQHNVDRMIDLEHLSLDETATNYDPDARGWFRLEVRNGDLWATNIVWNPDGVDRLTNRKQRYFSPAFTTDSDGRITKIVNVALTALPATHDAAPLIAASTRRKRMEFISLAAKFGAVKKLADETPPAEKGKAAAIADACVAAQTALEDYMKASAGADIDATLAALDAAKMAVDAFENAANALLGVPPDADADPVEMADPALKEEEKQLRALSVTVAEVKRLRTLAIEHEAEVKRLAAEKALIEAGERRELVSQLVRSGHETPATAWADELGTVPAAPWDKMNINALRSRVKTLSNKGKVMPNVSPATSGIVQTNDTNLTEFQINRLRATHDREKRIAPKALHRSFDEVLRTYQEVGIQQLKGAEAKGNREAVQRLSRGVNQEDVITGSDGKMPLTTLAAVQPIQQFGASSQRALEEFRLEYNSTLVSLPVAWAEELGSVLPGGSLKDTYPISFASMLYKEKVAQGGAATTPQSADVSIQKKLWSLPAQAQLVRIVKGDFAYIQQWQQNAQHMARARVFLRNQVVTTLLEAGLSGYWGQTQDQATGIDGQPFFSATHKINPFDPTIKSITGAATFSNYQATGAPLNAANLTAEKAAMIMVPGPDGQNLGSRATGLLNPLCLDETARLLLTVQDLILAADAQTSGTGKFGQVRNEHFMSGFEHMLAPQLAGSAATANYYLFSRETIGRGMPPWVIAEDAAEELRVWDESSDFYKDGGFIKIESFVYLNGGLLYPHGIRLVKGAT